MGLGAALINTILPKLNKIKIKKLFGYLDFDIELNKNETNISIIYGINGQGKTTLFKLITAIINGDYQVIDDIKFKKCELEFTRNNDNNKIYLSVEKVFTFPVFKWFISDMYDFAINDLLDIFKYNINGVVIPIQIKSNIFKNKKEDVKRLHFDEVDYELVGSIVDRIKELELPKASFIDAFRVFSPDEIYSTYNPNSKVKNIYNESINNINLLIRNIKKDFEKNRIESIDLAEVSSVDYEKYIKVKTMIEYLKINGWISNDFDFSYKKYLDYSFEEMNKLEDNERIKYLNSLYAYYISFKKFFFENEDFGRIDKFINVLNFVFLRSSKKRIGIFTYKLEMICFKNVIDSNLDYYNLSHLAALYKRASYKDSYGEIKIDYRFLDDTKEIYHIPLENASSGEKNLFILFYKLLVNIEANRIIFIDEPEISLHISAQEKLVNTMEYLNTLSYLNINHKYRDIFSIPLKYKYYEYVNMYEFSQIFNSHIVLITHSPVICQNHIEKMTELK